MRTKLDLQLSGRQFWIGTNRSKQLPFDSATQITPVIMDVAGFTDFADPTEPTSELDDNDCDLPREGIHITAPDLVPDQLIRNWERSFGGAN